MNANASTLPSTLHIGVSIIPPMVTKAEGGYGGFEIELWECIARELGITSEYTLLPFVDVLHSIQTKKLEVAIAAISMTEEREKTIDFTHTTFNSGLHILVPNKVRTGLLSSLRSVFNKEMGKILLFLFGFLFVAAHLVWFAETNGSGTLSGPYVPGVFNALWWALVTVSTIGYGDYTPVTTLGRIVGSMTILSGLAIFGFYIAQMSSLLTLKKLHSDITHHNDLRGKYIATVAGTYAEGALKKYGAHIVGVSVIAEAYALLEAGSVDAIVFDAPVLAHYAGSEGRGTSVLVGGLFERQDYAFALQDGSTYRESINQALLKIHESGEYARIYKKWFAGES